jgi:hypothetical protein
MIIGQGIGLGVVPAHIDDDQVGFVVAEFEVIMVEQFRRGAPGEPAVDDLHPVRPFRRLLVEQLLQHGGIGLMRAADRAAVGGGAAQAENAKGPGLAFHGNGHPAIAVLVMLDTKAGRGVVRGVNVVQVGLGNGLLHADLVGLFVSQENASPDGQVFRHHAVGGPFAQPEHQSDQDESK